MYTEDDILARRDTTRGSDELMRQLLGEDTGISGGNTGGCCDGGCSGTQSNRQGTSNPDSRAYEEDRHTWGLDGYPLAMVYSPIQNWRNIYDNETALMRGTIFEELDLPFMGKWQDSSGNGCTGNMNTAGGGKCGGGKNG